VTLQHTQATQILDFSTFFMKILAVSDFPIEDGLKQRVIDNNIDLIISCGDFGISGIKQLGEIDWIPKIGVYGNHCTRGYMEEFGIIDLHLKKIEINGITFAGFEGCVRYKIDKYAPMWTQEEADELVKKLPVADVIISHCPPFGINDQEDLAHEGFKALKNFLILNKPKAWFHGHTYPTEDNIINQFEDTKIFYTDPEIIVEI
jgi:uncharacterized protein